jgi:transposase InsO family protein
MDTWSPPGWFDGAEFNETARSFENPDWVPGTVNVYRSRFLDEEPCNPRYQRLADRLATVEVITTGAPASTLTDNGRVYTARFGGGRNAFEYLLPLLGVRQKNGSPGHPQTQGKIERFHQTLKRWL